MQYQPSNQNQQGTLAVSPLKLASRGAKDVCFAVLYIAVFIASIGIMAYCAGTAKDKIQEISQQCTTPPNTTGTHRLAAIVGADPGNDPIAADMLAAAPYLFGSFGFAVFFGIVWMTLLRYFAKPVVYGTLLIKGFILIALGIYMSMQVKNSGACTLTTGNCTAAMYPYMLCVLGLVYFLWLFCARRRIELTAKLLEQSILVVSTHPGLFLVSAVLLLVTAAMLLLAIAGYALLFLSQSVITPLPDGTCDFSWQATHVDEAMYLVLTIFLYWSTQLWLFVRFYIVSLTTGIWYYENESLAAQEGAVADKEYTRAPVCSSIQMALSKGFGTIALSSAIVAICEMLKSMARRSAGNNGLLGLLVSCCIMCIVNCIEFLTRFALTYAALTGDSLCDSGRTFLDSCTRHGFLKVVVVDYLASITLNFGALIFGLVVTAITLGMVEKGVLDGASHDDDRSSVLIAVGSFAWLIAFIVLHFIASLLLNIVDASYACVVLDLDNHARTGAFHRPQIAQAVLVKTKPDFVVVTQPAGGASCGAAYAMPTAVPIAQPVAQGRPVGY